MIKLLELALLLVLLIVVLAVMLWDMVTGKKLECR